MTHSDSRPNRDISDYLDLALRLANLSPAALDPETGEIGPNLRQVAAVRDALHDQDALRLREAAHKFYGMLSAFSTAAGDQAADLEDLAARRLLPEALPIVEQLDRCATELARLAGGLTIETLRKQAEPADDPNRTASP